MERKTQGLLVYNSFPDFAARFFWSVFFVWRKMPDYILAQVFRLNQSLPPVWSLNPRQCTSISSHVSFPELNVRVSRAPNSPWFRGELTCCCPGAQGRSSSRVSNRVKSGRGRACQGQGQLCLHGYGGGSIVPSWGFLGVRGFWAKQG